MFDGAELAGADLRGVYFKVKGQDVTGNLIPDYSQGGGKLCSAKDMNGAIVDRALKERLMKICPAKAKETVLNEQERDKVLGTT